jgi:hypothetical protein
LTRSASPLSSDVDVSRYEVEHKLGEGAAGAVYLARDRETGEHVALKKLFRMDAKSVLRLKREFRSLVDVTHPNIVKLYDMGRASDGWFLTMEYLEGVDLTTYLAAGASADARAALPSNDNVQANDRRRLSALRQLALGVHALHQFGMLHRDLKPSNVLVVNDRVVVLDFGLVRELTTSAATVTEEGAVAGTPAYMAPEQLLGKELSAASDWYSFGAILYEAISGLLPIDGSLMEMLRAKVDSDPTPLQELVPEVPNWLSELCTALLQREPEARPSGSVVVAAFDANRPSGATGEVAPTATENILTEGQDVTAATSLFGRHDELAKLWKALSQAEAGNAVVAYVRGTSGAGKSALIEHFLDDIEQGAVSGQSDVLVLRSRCYELEQMPFKALDAVMDALARHLSRLDDLDVAHILPPEIAALTQLFPVLERLRAVKRLVAGSKAHNDALNDRQRAELALRQLLDRLAARRPIVLWIDDLQWGDLDSARILRSWIEQPAKAPILFVFSYRSDEVTTSSCLLRLLQAEPDAAAPRAGEHTIDVSPLSSADIQALCEQRLGAHVEVSAELMTRIVREAQGSPFLASQLTALAEAKIFRGDTDLECLSIDVLVAQTSALLPPQAQQLLTVLAVAGRPMAPKLALAAAGVRHNGRALVRTLRGLNLVRTRDVAGERMLEVYHDRVREGVQAALDAEQSVLVHQSLLNSLEFSGQADPDWLHILALGAGQHATALEHGLAAAERANTSLAFERAAELYERCIGLTPATQTQPLWSKLALALVRCGRGTKAADAYLEAAKLATPAEAVVLTQLAASHFLRSGRFEQGEALVRQVLKEMNISVPESDAGLMAAIAWERARIKLRGIEYVPRRDAPASLLAKYDVFDALCATLQQYDPLRAALFQVRGLRCALEAGEPRRLVQSLCRTALLVAQSGSSQAGVESDALLDRAEGLARQVSERDYGIVCTGRALSAFMLGRMSAVLEPCNQAERSFRSDTQDDPQGNYYRRLVLAAVRAGALFHLGELARSDAELQVLLREARATDNRSLLLQLTLVQTIAEEIADQASTSRVRLDAQAQQLPPNSFGNLHTLHMVAVMHNACATGDYAWARDYLTGSWQSYLRSPMHRGGYLALAVHLTRARLLLNQYLVEGRKGALPAEIRRDLRAALRNPVSIGSASTLAARLAYLEDKVPKAVELMRRSIEEFSSRHMPAEVARSRYALAALLGGTEQAALQASAIQQLSDLGVANPMADLRAWFPEFTNTGR